MDEHDPVLKDGWFMRLVLRKAGLARPTGI
jgi:hypothetical protein